MRQLVRETRVGGAEGVVGYDFQVEADSLTILLMCRLIRRMRHRCLIDFSGCAVEA